MANFWDYHISDHDSYIRSYGEGEGSANRTRLFKYIDEGDHVLDVGCGPGCNLGHEIEYAKKGIKYRGVDISPKFIEACQARFPGSDFVVGDANKLDEADKSWDVVILQDVLEHLDGYKKAIAEANRVARKRIIICMWVGLLDGPDNVRDLGDGGYHSEYNRVEFMKTLESLGGTLRTDEENYNRTHYYYIIDL